MSEKKVFGRDVSAVLINQLEPEYEKWKYQFPIKIKDYQNSLYSFFRSDFRVPVFQFNEKCENC